jgi:hypothetical protein
VTLRPRRYRGAPLLEGVISDNYLPNSGDSTDPWITLFKKINTDYNGDAAWDGNVVYGFLVRVPGGPAPTAGR